MCLSPTYMRGRLSDKSDSRFVPCGYCAECVRRKKLDWQIRLDAAMHWADCSFFRLLTYDPEHYNFNIYDKEVIKDHIQRFMKRLRRRLEYHFGKHIRIKYFIASEYGETYDRLHYHCLFFVKGAKFTWIEMASIIRSCWPYGIVGNTYNLNPQRCVYAVKYIQKQYNCKFFSKFEIFKIAPELEKKYRTESRYSVYDYNQLPTYSLNGKLVALPYYWMTRLFSRTEILAYRDCLARNDDRKTLIEKSKENDARLSRQYKFNYENSVGFKVPDRKPVDNTDILPNLKFYVTNI